MTPDELLKAENAFIRLYNQGVLIEDIVAKLKVEITLVKEWELELKKALDKHLDYMPVPLKISILEKLSDGTYVYNQSFSFEMSNVDKVHFDLWRLSLVNNERLSEGGKQIQAKAASYANNVRQTFLDIKFENRDDGVSYNIVLKEGASSDIAHEILEFYSQYVLMYESIERKSVVVESESVDVFSEPLAILPYCIKKLVINKFEFIIKVSIGDFPIDSNWIFLSGENGFGKTSFLRAIAISLVGNEDEGQNLIDNIDTKMGIEFKRNNLNEIRNLWATKKENCDFLACYGPSRLLIQSKMSQNEVSEKSSTTYGLFNPDGILLNIESKLIEWYLEKNVRLSQVRTLFQEIIPSLADISIHKNKQGDYEVLYTERDMANFTNMYEPVSFERLAAGPRSILGLVGDLLIRFIRKQPDVEKLSDLAGIVIIDELENHLHPKWQYQLPTLLSKAFPNIQFIASTHSVIPILGAPKNSVFLKLNRSKENGISVDRIEMDMSNLLPNSILTSPIFDMDLIRPITNVDPGELRTEDTYDEIVVNDKIERELNDLDKDPSQYPALLEE